MRNLKIVLVCFFMLVVAVGSARAQVLAAAHVSGTVTDASGGVVPGADVQIVDTSTNEARTTQTNKAGHYEFVGLRIGTYTITMKAKGFRQFVITNAKLDVPKDFTFDATLEVGAPTQVVEVRATVGAELQTENSTMSTSFSGNAVLNMPSLDRDISAVLSFVPTASPSYTGDPGGNETGGQIGGAMSDQNTYTLDGGKNTSVLEGDNAYVNAGHGVVPTPIESIEEFKVNTNNMTADFSTSGGAQVLLVTKRGSNAFHGSAYDYYQSSALDSNDWYNNFHGIPKPVTHQNRFGGSVGGPMLPPMAGGKTYFYVNYEGERYPRAGPFTRLVPSDTLRQGILQFKDAAGNIVQYNLKTSTQCGPSGGVACDPLGIGINPVVSQMWSQYEPEPNDLTAGDRLNTFGYIGSLSYPLSTNFGVVRIDHDFGAKNRFFGSYRYFSNNNPTENQVDMGGLIKGDTKGDPVSVSSNPIQPRFFVTGLTTTLSPTLTNDFHFSFTRDYWRYDRKGALPELSGFPEGIEIGGESVNALIPMNMDTQDARRRIWDAHDFDYRDTLSWLKGTHFLQFGGEVSHQWDRFVRYDGVVSGITDLVNQLSDGAAITGAGTFGSSVMNIEPQYQPPTCATSSSTNCLPSAQINNWNGYYGMLLGFDSTNAVVATRSGPNLNLNPLGQPLPTNNRVMDYSLYFSDAWKIRPNITLTYGLNWSVQMPPVEQNGVQGTLVDAAGNILTPESYLANRLAAANNGQVYFPTIGYDPVGDIGSGLKYPFQPWYGGFGPRVSLAWSPTWDSGPLGWLFGHKSTVIRGGYARFYDRTNAIDFISDTVAGAGYLQPVGCTGAAISGVCAGPGGVDPNTAFRLGVNGNTGPLPAITQTQPLPFQPGINGPYEELAAGFDYHYRPASSDQIDLSIQRQLKGDMILEVGYVGRWAKHLFQGLDINDVPWMMKLGGQTFAQAFANLWSNATGTPLPGQTSPSPLTAQPFLETALAGSSYCTGFANCTAAVAANEFGNIVTNSVTSLWSDLEGSWTNAAFPLFQGTTPLSLISSNQALWAYSTTSDGFANYQALVISLQKRASHGLTLNGNFTYGHSLGTSSINQEYTLANLDDPWNLRVDYGPQMWDRKFTSNIAGTYQLPFGKGMRWSSSNPVLSRIIGGWSLSPVFSFGSGLPLEYYNGSCQEYGNGWAGICAGMVPMVNTRNLSNSPQFGTTQSGLVGSSGNAANGGSGVNIFGNNAAQVYNDFRPTLPGIDYRSNTTGIMRGLSRYNLDLGINKETRVTERVSTQFYVQMFNATSHMQFCDPGWSPRAGVTCIPLTYLDPPDFGHLNDQFNVINGNYTRVIQLGLRLSF